MRKSGMNLPRRGKTVIKKSIYLEQVKAVRAIQEAQPHNNSGSDRNPSIVRKKNRGYINIQRTRRT